MRLILYELIESVKVFCFLNTNKMEFPPHVAAYILLYLIKIMKLTKLDILPPLLAYFKLLQSSDVVIHKHKRFI